MFIVPLESYSGASCDTTSTSTSANKPNLNTCLCPGTNFNITPPPYKLNYHLLRGELKAYQDAKPRVDICEDDQPIKLFL